MATTVARFNLDDKTILSLAKMKAITSVFPFMKQALHTGHIHTCCKKRTPLTNRHLHVMSGIKRTIAKMTPDQKNRLKHLLNTTQVSVSYLEGTKPVTVRF